MTILQALLLGFVQGATEFLPVSSSGHLVIVERLMVLPDAERLALAAGLHGGTALAVIVYFRRRLGQILAGLFRAGSERRESLRIVGAVAAGSVPAGVVGLLFRDRIDSVFSRPVLVGALLVVTGVVLFATRFGRERRDVVGWLDVACIGLAQAAAVLPGISRSGATIAAAVLLGVSRPRAFEFSFLLSVPLVLAAAVLEMVGIDYSVLSPVHLGLGIAVAFAVGLASIALLRRAVVGRWLHWFAVYCCVAGLLVLLLMR